MAASRETFSRKFILSFDAPSTLLRPPFDSPSTSSGHALRVTLRWGRSGWSVGCLGFSRHDSKTYNHVFLSGVEGCIWITISTQTPFDSARGDVKGEATLGEVWIFPHFLGRIQSLIVTSSWAESKDTYELRFQLKPPSTPLRVTFGLDLPPIFNS
jgi:hypothetical protein